MILKLLVWIPWLIIYISWARRYDIFSKEYEFEMPRTKKNVFVSKRKGTPARFENQISKSK